MTPIRARSLAEGARLVALVLVAVWVCWLSRHAERPVLAAAIGVVAVLGLWGWRRWPIVALVLAFGCLLAAVHLADYPGPDDPFILIVVLASFGVGRYAALRAQPWAAAGTLLLLSLNLLDADTVLPADVVFPTLFTAVPWLLGLLVQTSQRRAQHAMAFAGEVEAAGLAAVRRATEEERLRIAGELHDVVAHSVSTLSLQAQLTRRRLEAGDAVTVADLRQIEGTAQEAMTELRRLLALLHPAGSRAELTPPEDLTQLTALVDGCRRSGQRVDLVERGEPRSLPPALSLAAYRIVQEGLTNARRHGSGGLATVGIDWTARSVVLEIANTVPMDRPAAQPGHGLVGMHERSRLFGGSFEAGAVSGRWLVRAELPTPALVDTGA